MQSVSIECMDVHMVCRGYMYVIGLVICCIIILRWNFLRALIIISLAACQAIKRLKVQCSNSLNTAGQELGRHEANCDENAIIPCPNLCLIPSSPEAGEARYTTRTMPKKDVQNHLLECPRRKAICGYCGISGVVPVGSQQALA